MNRSECEANSLSEAEVPSAHAKLPSRCEWTFLQSHGLADVVISPVLANLVGNGKTECLWIDAVQTEPFTECR